MNYAVNSHYRRTTRAFTLIELLVVMAVISVLMGILLPSLSRARKLAAATRELAAGQSLIQAYHLYADDNRQSLLPGYVPGSWVSSSPAGAYALSVVDDQGHPVTGVPAQRYPWRLAPYFNYDFRALYKDERVLSRYRERSDFQYVVSLSPSFGLNSTFLGGDADRFGFNPVVLANPAVRSFYMTRLDQAQRGADLVAFAAAHGVNPDGGDLVPGFFRVDAPYLQSRRWASTWNKTDPGTAGNVDFRHESKAPVAFLDGHSASLSMPELDDMRRWSDRATTPDWYLGSP